MAVDSVDFERLAVEQDLTVLAGDFTDSEVETPAGTSDLDFDGVKIGVFRIPERGARHIEGDDTAGRCGGTCKQFAVGIDIDGFSGKITIDGTDVTHLPEYKRAKYIGRVFQDPMMGTAATMQIEENLALAARRGKARTLRVGITRSEREEYREKLKMLGLGLEDRMTSKVGLLSGGQRQALTLLMATLKKPKLLLLDEPAAGMNPQETQELGEFVAQIKEKYGLSILLIEHHMDFVMNFSDRIYAIDFGKLICSGTPDVIANDQRVIDAYLGVSEDE